MSTHGKRGASRLKLCPHCKEQLTPHGLGAYNGGCRCDVCRAAASKRSREYYLRNKQEQGK
jgi:hypothetical protein